MSIVTKPFGRLASGEEATLVEISCANGMRASVTDVGASLVGCVVPDRLGGLRDIVLGLRDGADYSDNLMAFGGTVGRVSGRIAGARYTLDGHEVTLVANADGNAMHGGSDMWFERQWRIDGVGDLGEDGGWVRLSLLSPDGDQGFAGTVRARVTYSLSQGILTVSQTAHASSATPVAMTLHGYWNLDGHDAGDVLDHELFVDAPSYLALDATGIPTGELASVEGTALDFRRSKAIREGLSDGLANLDHTMCLAGMSDESPQQDRTDRPEAASAATLFSPTSGIEMTVETSYPGIQVFTPHLLAETRGKGGAFYGHNAGAALEPQMWPDAIHHEVDWPQATWPVISPTHEYSMWTRYLFGTRE